MAYGLTDGIDPGVLRRALVIKLRHHGDVLLASPLFSVLKKHAPGIEIDALVYEDTRDMLALHPAITAIHTVGRDWKRGGLPGRFGNEWRLLAALRERKFDLVVHLSEHPRGAWLARVLGPRYSVAPDFPNKQRLWKESFSHLFALPHNPRRHMVEWNLDSLRRLGIQPAEDERALVLVPGIQVEREVEGLLAAAGVVPKQFVHVHPGSRWQFKCWPAERTAALIDALADRGERVVLTGAPDADEAALLAAIRARAKSAPVDMSGKLSLKGLAALTARARLFIGVDSAPMHIAAAMGTPVVALFGPSGEFQWGPWQVSQRVVKSERHPCRPCGQDGCGGGKVSDCLTTMPVQSVLEAALTLLSR